MVDKDKLTNYICKDCNYKFKRKPGVAANRCPYCGSDRVLKYEPVLASDLLDSVETER